MILFAKQQKVAIINKLSRMSRANLKEILVVSSSDDSGSGSDDEDAHKHKEGAGSTEEDSHHTRVSPVTVGDVELCREHGAAGPEV